MKKVSKIIDSSVIIFAVEVIGYFILSILYKFTWVNYIDSIADVLGFVLVIWMIITVITGIITFIRVLSNVSMKGKRVLTLVVLLSFSIIQLWGYTSEIENGYTTSGTISILAKSEIEGDYYLTIRRPNYIDNRS